MVFTDYTVEISIKLDALIERKHCVFLSEAKIHQRHVSIHTTTTNRTTLPQISS